VACPPRSSRVPTTPPSATPALSQAPARQDTTSARASSESGARRRSHAATPALSTADATPYASSPRGSPSAPPATSVPTASATPYSSVATSAAPCMATASGVAACRPNGYRPPGACSAARDARAETPTRAMPATV
jgi:hypothetical protein